MRHHILLSALALAALPRLVGAQAPMPETDLVRPERAVVGGNLYFTQPVKEFAGHVKQAWGGNVNGTLGIGPSGVFGLRFDAGAMLYGRERVRDQCISNCRVRLDVTTSNNIAYGSVGPQITVPHGPLRPYVNGHVGWTFLWTDSQIEGTNADNQPFASSTNLSDNTFAYGGGAGVLVPVATSSRNPVYVDLGARYVRNGRVEYLRKGDIVDQPTGPPILNIQRSRADLVSYYVGVSVGIR